MPDFAIDDYAEIAKFRKAIAEAEIPRCPISPEKHLASCLREGARCPDTCKYQADWTGPNGP